MLMACITHLLAISILKKQNHLLEKYLGSLPASPKENKFKDNGVRMIKGLTEANLKKGKESQSYDQFYV